MVRPYKTASEYAFEMLKKWILEGKLMPGEHIDQENIAKELDISKLPIRYALEQLAQKGLVTIIPHRGVIVKKLSENHMTELYVVRNHLEHLAIEEAMKNYTDKDINRLREMIKEEEEVISNDDINLYSILNRKFHLSIYEPCNNSILMNQVKLLFDQGVRYQRTYLNSGENMKQSIHDHKEIFEAICKKDLKAASEVSKRHNSKTQEFLIKNVHLLEEN